MENTLIFEENTGTIRQMPQNYSVADRNQGYWVCNPDISADPILAQRVFKSLFIYDNRYGTGLNLLASVTPNEEFKFEGDILEIISFGKGEYPEVLFIREFEEMLSKYENVVYFKFERT